MCTRLSHVYIYTGSHTNQQALDMSVVKKKRVQKYETKMPQIISEKKHEIMKSVIFHYNQQARYVV